MRTNRFFRAASSFAFAALIAGCGGGGGGDNLTGSPSPGPPTAVTAVTGAQAGVVAGTTTPIPLTAKVADAGGRGVPGVTVTWGTQSGSINPVSATTDASGQSTAQWTPGTVAGMQAAAATVNGVGSVSFPVTVSAAALAKIKFTADTVRLTKVGETALVVTAGNDAFGNFISAVGPTYTIDDPTVATLSAGQTSFQITALKTGTTLVHATQAAVTASVAVLVNIAASADPCSAISASVLAVGQSMTLIGPDASAFCVQGATDAEFVAIPFYGTGNDGSSATSFSVTLAPLSANVAAVGPPSPNVLSATMASSRLRSAMVSASRQPTRDLRWEMQFRERTRRELQSRLVARAGARRTSSGLRKSLGTSSDFPPPAVGSKMSLNVDLSFCVLPPAGSIHTAIVQAVSKNAIVVEDSADEGGFTPRDYQSFADAFDTLVVPVDTLNFGQPTDIDNNSRAILFFTKAVNLLSDPNSGSFVGGFFFARDLFYKDTHFAEQGGFFCPGSNQGEMFYLLAPWQARDPRITVSFVRSITVGTIAHEFQHLINAAQHIWINQTPFSNHLFETTFLDEGLAHVAEELTFYRASGLQPLSNVTLASINSGPAADAFLSYQRQNALRFREYLKTTSKNSPYSTNADTSLAVRGGIWSFLRYATDRKGGDQTKTWRLLVAPAADSGGIGNLQAVFGQNILAQMRDWTVANYVDDAITPANSAFLNPSWNTRDIETYVNSLTGADGKTFPLNTLSLTGAPMIVGIADGGAAYLRFGVGSAASIGGATVSSSSGGALPSSFSITIVRTK